MKTERNRTEVHAFKLFLKSKIIWIHTDVKYVLFGFSLHFCPKKKEQLWLLKNAKNRLKHNEKL